MIHRRQQKTGENGQMQKQKKNRYLLIKLATLLLTMGMVLGINGCAGASLPFSKSTKNEDTKASLEETSTFHDYRTIFGVVTALDTNAKTMSVLNINNREAAEFTYTGGTMVRNKYGDSISMAQVRIGELIDLEYEKVNGKIKELKISSEAWELTNITAFSIDRTNKTIQIGSYLYQYDSSIAIVSDGQLVAPIEISDKDELTIKGYGTTVHSIIITKGHGYVSLENEEYFLDGILTIGKTVKQISENMLVVVPEGEYVLEVTKGSIKGRKQIRVVKNEELSVDIKSFVAEARQMGTVNFKIQPENAKLYINGKETSYKEVATLEYGTYTIRAEAEGYVTFTEKYQIEGSYQEKIITLEAKETESSMSSEETSSAEQENTEPGTTVVTLPATEATSGTQTTQNSNTEQTTTEKSETVSSTTSGAPSSISSGDVSGYQIHITEPSKTEVYFDGSYIGMAPVTLQKVSGEHTIILKKDGCVTKTYTVNISSDQIDSYYSFPALAEN